MTSPRWFVLGLALVVACGASGSDGDSAKRPSSGDDDDDESDDDDQGGDDGDDDATAPAKAKVSVHAVFDLPREAKTQALSAISFDLETKTLFALSDRMPRIVPLVGSDDWKTWSVGTPLVFSGSPDSAWDGEGLVRTRSAIYAVTVETSATLARFGQDGVYQEKLAVPAHFTQQASGNKGIESLSIAPSGKFLFFANEAALTIDGEVATKTTGTTVRLFRRELATASDEEHAYRTEPLGAGGTAGDMGVSELVALDDTTVLVLERGYQPGYGSTVRIFKVSIAGDPNVLDVPALDGTTPVLKKDLLVDVGALPSDGIAHPGTQPNPILDNYEGMALGPTLSDGSRLFFLLSDDNASSSQVARVLVLAVSGL